ncbi:patatin-like phospholipase family protein [Acetobacterium fimetarium]|uniref:Patatin-like phospholipase family protein n=1 Tax=Acetobacterium fimetarium TaxID=52691 RepID=A0ABR6WSR5_9FIRM|nr:patatin-like phospholipase family protein [Acetobacterium fimetarium]MBC3803606.1 patatin-like phospholipase family protein [Acetobacterium fimetarium]
MSQCEYGLVLSGGGAKGAFEMGVWKALRECNYSLGAVIGTSVGALNAAVIAQDNFDLGMEFWSNLTINQVLNLNREMTNTYLNQWSKENFDVFRNGFLNILFSDGLDITPLRENLNRLISEDAIRKSPIRLGLVTVDLTSLTPRQMMIEEIPEGQLIDYLLASSALPVFQKQEIDGKTYLDGGFFDNVPINFMIEQNFNKIISVEFPAIGMRKWVREKNVEIITVNNSQLLGGTLNFDTERIQQNIQLGYLDAMKAFGAVDGKYYYLDTQNNNTIYQKFQKQLGMPLSNPKQRKKMLSLLQLPETADQNAILAALENLQKKTIYKNRSLPLSLLEITGKNLGVSRLENYPIDFFFQALLKQLNTLLAENLNVLENPGIIKTFFTPSSDNFLRFNFITFYIVFLSIRNDLAPDRELTFMSKFTPEVSLSMITIFYIHELIKH